MVFHFEEEGRISLEVVCKVICEIPFVLIAEDN